MMEVIPFLISAVVLITNFLIFDFVLRVQYGKYREQWVEDGMPQGVFFFPPETGSFLHPKFDSWMAKGSLYLTLLFVTPEWMRAERKLGKLLALYRALHAILVVTWVLVAFLNLVRK